MRLPQDLSGERLVKALETLGYTITRRESSHVRLTTETNGEHYVTIPDHSPLRVGTLAHIIGDIAEHFGMTRDDLLQKLSGRY